MQRTGQKAAEGPARRPAAESQGPSAPGSAALDQRPEASDRRALFQLVRGAAAPPQAKPTRTPKIAHPAPVVQRVPLNLPHPRLGNPARWLVETGNLNSGAMAGWITEASQNNLPGLRTLIRQLTALKNSSLFGLVEQNILIAATNAFDVGMAQILVPGATYIPGDINFSTALDANATVIMRAINTGDMYQVRASMALHPTFNLLIWNVNGPARKQAEMAAAIINDPGRVFYTDRPTPPPGFNLTETWTTSDIEENVSSDLLLEDNLQDYLEATGTDSLMDTVGADALTKHNYQGWDDTQRLAWWDQFLRGQGMASLADAANRAPTQSRKSKKSSATAPVIALSDSAKLVRLIKAYLGRLRTSETKAEADRYAGLQDQHRRYRIADLANRYAPYDARQGRAFQADLERHGGFADLDRGVRCVIVNFRDTGHSPRPGANAPALDTGLEGVEQIIRAVHERLGEDVRVIPMGEQPSRLRGGPNLLEYWNWPSVKATRLDQTLLLKYLKDNYNIIGAVGMRSGVMDQLALLGIPIVSIDIGPHRGLADGVLPDLATSKGWDRGMKLEDSYKQNYGHAFIEHERKDERTRRLPQWSGAFHADDIETIADAISFYLGEDEGRAGPENYRHISHPLSEPTIRRALAQFIQVLGQGICPYDLIEHLHPYVGQLAQLAKSRRRGEAASLAPLLETFEAQVRAMIAAAQRGQPQSIEWMRDHRRPILLNDDYHHRLYHQQALKMADHFGVPRSDAQLAVFAYRALHAHYRKAISAQPLQESFTQMVVAPMLISGWQIVKLIEAALDL